MKQTVADQTDNGEGIIAFSDESYTAYIRINARK